MVVECESDPGVDVGEGKRVVDVEGEGEICDRGGIMREEGLVNEVFEREGVEERLSEMGLVEIEVSESGEEGFEVS